MLFALLLVLNYLIGVSAGNVYDRQEADACVTINQRLTVKGGSGRTLVTHRGTNESIAHKIRQGYIEAHYPTPDNNITRMLDHSKSAVWVSEGKPTLFNRIFSGMIGKRGEASITFEVDADLVKKPDGIIKRFFGSAQRVIEQDIPIPEDAVVRFGGGNR